MVWYSIYTMTYCVWYHIVPAPTEHWFGSQVAHIRLNELVFRLRLALVYVFPLKDEGVDYAVGNDSFYSP